MDLVYIAFGLIFSVFGVLFAYGKVLPYLKAWQNMSEEEKAQIRIEPLCRNIGIMIVLSGLIFFFRGMIPGFSHSLFIALIVAWLVGAGFDCYWIEKSARYEVGHEGKAITNSRIGSDRRKDL